MAADASPRFVEAIVNLNLLAPLWCAQSAHKVMAVQEDGGCIVNVSSVSGHAPVARGRRPTARPRPGLINLTTTLAVEWAPLVRVNCVTRRAARHRRRRRLLRRPRGHGAGGRHRAARPDGDPGRRGRGLPLPGQRAAVLRHRGQPGVHGGGEWPAFLRGRGRVRRLTTGLLLRARLTSD